MTAFQKCLRVMTVEREAALVLSKLESFNANYQNWLQLKDKVQLLNNNSLLKKRNQRTAICTIKSHVSDFYSNMSLPGVKYMGENGRIDRYVWVFILILSIFITSKYIEDAYKKWQDSPILLSFNDSLTELSQIAFPAVTLCPPSQISLDYNLTDSIEHCQQERDCNTTEWSQFEAARLLCPNALFKVFTDYFRTPHMNKHVQTYFRQVSSHCKDQFQDVIFPDTGGAPCNYLLQTVFVEEKVCFTFNMLKAEDIFNDGVIPPMIDDTTTPSKPHWKPEWMVQLADLYNTVPRYVETDGESDQLIFVLKNITDTQKSSCQHSYTNTKIALHNPVEIPSEQSHKFEPVPHDSNVKVQAIPIMYIAENQLIKYTPNKRRCYFENEVKLALFRVYTKPNCKTECYINCTLNVCGCVPFYMPRLNENTTLCTTPLEITCLQTKLKELTKDLGRFKSSRASQQKFIQEIKANYPKCICNCEDDCAYVNYVPTVEKTTQDDKDSLRYGDSRTLRVTFFSTEFSSKLRKELIGFTDFIANSGGVLGVFTGFSFVAVIELLYYLTIRLWVNVKHSWKHYEGASSSL